MDRYEIKFENSGYQDDYSMQLQIWVDGKLVNSFWDGGEPEDNSFGRDWSWVSGELEKAYKLGFDHGIEHEFETSSRGF